MLNKLLTSILVIVAIWLLRYLVIQLVLRRVEDPKLRYQWRKTANYVAFVIGVLLVGRIWIEAFQTLSTFLGLLSAGIAIALKEPLLNIAGWAYIIWLRPVKVGDRIQVGDQAGDVVDQGLFQLSVMEIGGQLEGESPTGRIIYIPNGAIFSQGLANYSHGFPYVWNEIPVTITFESDWEKTKDILEKIAKEHGETVSQSAEKALRKTSHKFLIHEHRFQPRVFTEVRENGINLTIRYMCAPHERRATVHAIWEDILIEFAKHDDIALAYPTTRIYREPEEGIEAKKPGKKAPSRKLPRAHD
ncbi:MAG: mechanosensitive ion channel family protein [Fidelibacterota bacterium]|nr:MAG: mechanosensitive ion channel family protein [Candidatus Neomarinimicrobiota bacterium]